jgi:hypothetical protein
MLSSLAQKGEIEKMLRKLCIGVVVNVGGMEKSLCGTANSRAENISFLFSFSSVFTLGNYQLI